ncbi:unnamed protein product, partial [marine sediment metagenome]
GTTSTIGFCVIPKTGANRDRYPHMSLRGAQLGSNLRGRCKEIASELCSSQR